MKRFSILALFAVATISNLPGTVLADDGEAAEEGAVAQVPAEETPAEEAPVTVSEEDGEESAP